jgi:hypothetical protein
MVHKQATAANQAHGSGGEQLSQALTRIPVSSGIGY